MIAAFFRNRGAVFGLAVLLLVCLMAALAPVVFPFSPWDMQGGPFTPPGEDGFWLGSDSLGRDVAADIAYGASVSLLIGAVSTVAGLAIGVTLGAVAGYAGGFVDDADHADHGVLPDRPELHPGRGAGGDLHPASVLHRGGDRHRVLAARHPGGAGGVPHLRSREFVQAAEVLGRSRTAIIFREILPNALSPIIVLASLMVASAVLLESACRSSGSAIPT